MLNSYLSCTERWSGWTIQIGDIVIYSISRIWPHRHCDLLCLNYLNFCDGFLHRFITWSYLWQTDGFRNQREFTSLDWFLSGTLSLRIILDCPATIKINGWRDKLCIYSTYSRIVYYVAQRVTVCLLASSISDLWEISHDSYSSPRLPAYDVVLVTSILNMFSNRFEHSHQVCSTK